MRPGREGLVLVETETNFRIRGLEDCVPLGPSLVPGGPDRVDRHRLGVLLYGS